MHVLVSQPPLKSPREIGGFSFSARVILTMVNRGRAGAPDDGTAVSVIGSRPPGASGDGRKWINRSWNSPDRVAGSDAHSVQTCSTQPRRIHHA